MEPDLRELAREFLAFVHDVTKQPMIVCDEQGTIIEAVDPERIGSTHAGAQRILRGEVDEVVVTAEEAARDPRMKPGVSVPIVVDGRRVGTFGLTGPREVAQPVIRMAAVVLASWIKERRAQAERLAIVGQLAAGVAHEINNPLAFVSANLQFLEANASEGTATREELEAIFQETRSGVARIGRIVGSLRVFASDGVPDAGRCLVLEAVDEAIRLVSPRLDGRIQVEVSIARELAETAVGRRQLSEVLVKLLSNAADALEETAAERAPVIRVAATSRNGGVEIVVEDNGPGLSGPALAHLFEPFFTTKGPRRGMGLGLAVVREQLKRCGGAIEGQCRPGAGARFALWLPIARS
jgi:signal transduction histidine kinase